jgi:hypothetical protein
LPKVASRQGNFKKKMKIMMAVTGKSRRANAMIKWIPSPTASMWAIFNYLQMLMS